MLGEGVVRGVEEDCALFALFVSCLLAPVDCIINLQPHSEDKGVVFFSVLFGIPVWIWSNKLLWRTRRPRCVAIVAVWFASVMKGHPLRAVGCACTSESISTCKGRLGDGACEHQPHAVPGVPGDCLYTICYLRASKMVGPCFLSWLELVVCS